VTDEVEIIDYKTLYENAQKMWKDSTSKDQKKQPKKLQSTNKVQVTDDK
jgi:hypothetical protein